MPRIVKCRQAPHLPGYCCVWLSCGHRLVRTNDDALRVGSMYGCEACEHNERTISSIRTTCGEDSCQVILSCGHIRRAMFTDLITYQSVGDFVGTAMPCAVCRDRAEQ